MGWAIGMFAEEVANYSELRGMHRSGGLGFEPARTPTSLNGKLVPAVSADRQDRKAALLAKSRLLEERHRRCHRHQTGCVVEVVQVPRGVAAAYGFWADIQA